jgi:hypothetical protein
VAEIDAAVRRQIVRRLRCGVRLEVASRSDCGTMIARDAYHDHVAFNELAEMNAGIKTFGHEVNARLVPAGRHPTAGAR